MFQQYVGKYPVLKYIRPPVEGPAVLNNINDKKTFSIFWKLGAYNFFNW